MSTLPTAYIATQGSRIRLDGPALVVTHTDGSTAQVQLGLIAGLVLLGAIEITSAAQLALADRGIGCVFATRGGRIRGILAPQSQLQSSRRMLQYQLESQRTAAADAPRPLAIAHSIVHAKIQAMLGLMTQHHRSHDDTDLAVPIQALRRLLESAERAPSIDILRGYEGAAAAQYFAAFPAFCRTELTTDRRTRRPPKDPMNAALSLGYGLLVGELTATLLARGLDPHLGLLHPPADGRPSLALDLVEPLRHAIVDRLALRAANRREITVADFEPVESAEGAGVHFNDAGRARFLHLYQAAMSAPLTGVSSTPRCARWLISNAVEEYELALEGTPRSDDAAVSEIAQLP